MPPPPPPPSSDPLTFRAVISALCITLIIFLITEATDHSTYGIMIPIFLLSLCLMVYSAIAIVAQIFSARQLISCLWLFQTHDDQMQINVSGHDEQAGRQEASEMVLPPPTIYDEVNSGSWKQCGICMEDFVEGESCRVLPTCDHTFHLICIDSWLKLHPSCPICRNCVCRCATCVLDV